MYIYIYIYVCMYICVCVYVCMYVYIHIHTNRRSNVMFTLRQNKALTHKVGRFNFVFVIINSFAVNLMDERSILKQFKWQINNRDRT